MKKRQCRCSGEKSWRFYLRVGKHCKIKWRCWPFICLFIYDSRRWKVHDYFIWIYGMLDVL